MADFFAIKIEKNVESCTNLVEKNRNRDLISVLCTIFQKKSSWIGLGSQNPVKKFILKEFAGRFFSYFSGVSDTKKTLPHGHPKDP